MMEIIETSKKAEDFGQGCCAIDIWTVAIPEAQ